MTLRKEVDLIKDKNSETKAMAVACAYLVWPIFVFLLVILFKGEPKVLCFHGATLHIHLYQRDYKGNGEGEVVILHHTTKLFMCFHKVSFHFCAYISSPTSGHAPQAISANLPKSVLQFKHLTGALCASHNLFHKDKQNTYQDLVSLEGRGHE